MKRTLIILFIISTFAITAHAQGNPPHGFDPKRFQADMELFITREACLTPQEAAKFFPVFREMGKKQRALYEKAPHGRHMKPADDAKCRQAILDRDELELQVKIVQQQYHLKFMEILPPSKVYDVIRAEERFHRQSFQQMAGFRRGGR